MKIKYLKIFVIGACLFFSGCQNPLSKNPVIGIIKNLSGVIKYYPGGSEEFVTLRLEDIDRRPLFSMDMLELSKNSFLHLHFYNHGDAFLGNEKTETKLIIKKPSNNTKFEVITELKKGIMDCFIEKKGSRFAVQTPVAVAGVLGTLFKVAVEDDKTTVTMIDGDNGIEIQNINQSIETPKILNKIQQIEIIHSLVDRETLLESSKPPIGMAPVLGKVGLASSRPADSDLGTELAPVKIINFDNPLDFKYPSGVNASGELEFSSYIEYEGKFRTKTYSR